MLSRHLPSGLPYGDSHKIEAALEIINHSLQTAGLNGGLTCGGYCHYGAPWSRSDVIDCPQAIVVLSEGVEAGEVIVCGIPSVCMCVCVFVCTFMYLCVCVCLWRMNVFKYLCIRPNIMVDKDQTDQYL